MWQAHTVEQLREQRAALSGRVAFVPTMGALHEGHLSLIHTAQQHADHVLVSIFVNPTQFGPNEDLDQYPRPLEQDLAACRDAGVLGAFVPAVDEVYPPGGVACEIDVPALTGVLEGAHRPGHFGGVCRVVAKLFQMAQPDCAVFGRKDYQQLCVVRAMTNDLAMPIQIIESPTIREADGLAMSSRNQYLDAEQRTRAVALYRALTTAKQTATDDPATPSEQLEQRMAEQIERHGLVVEYTAVRHAQTLEPIADAQHDAVALVAARLGSVRLIDNMALG